MAYKDKEREKEYKKKYYEEHKNEIKKWYEDHKNEKKEQRINIRMQIQNIYGNRCAKCGESDPNVLTINHKLSPKNEVYNGLYRSGCKLYKQLLGRPDVRQYFNLLCMNCQQLDKLEKQNYFLSEWSKTATYFRKQKEKICELYDNRCMKCK